MADSTIQKRLDEYDYKSNDNSKVKIQNKQGIGKFTTAAQELSKIYDDYIRFTFSSEEFKKALKKEFDGNINQFNQNLVLYALTLAYMEKMAAEGDEELKKLLPSLQEKRDAINKNIEKIAKELGYTVSRYSLDKLMGKDLNRVKETLAKDFGVEPELEALFSSEALNSLTDLFAFMVNKYPISSVNASVAAVPIVSDKNNKTEDKDKQKSAEEKAKEESVKVLQQQNEEYHSPYRKTGKNIAITGVVLGILGGLLFAGGFVYLPMAAFGLLGIGLAELGFSIFWIGGAIWIAGLMGEAWHNHRVQKAQEKALKQEEEKRKKAPEKEEKEKKKIEKAEEKYKLWKATNAEKDEEALKKQLTDSSWLEKHMRWLEKLIKAETKAEHEKRVKEAKEEIEKIMEEAKKLEEAKKRDYSTAFHELLIEKAKDPNTPSWFLALLAQLRLSYHYTDLDMFKALAGNPNTPPELLADFATRKRYFWTREYIGSDIREIAAKNPSTPPEILAKLLLGDKDPRVEYAVAANPRTPTDALDTAMYSKKVDRNIKVVIAMNPSTSPDALEYALKDKDLALYALYNPSISKYPYLLELALKNPDRSVSEKAREILEKRIKELEEQNKGNENKQE